MRQGRAVETAPFAGASRAGVEGGLPVLKERTADQGPITVPALARTRQYRILFLGRSEVRRRMEGVTFLFMTKGVMKEVLVSTWIW